MAIPVPVTDNKAMVAAVTAIDGALATAVAIVKTPADDSYVEVIVGGIQEEVGDGVKTKACFFSGDGGTTARLIADIVAGDFLRWNGTIADYELKAIMKIDFNYIAL